jgi:hypothetical protein
MRSDHQSLDTTVEGNGEREDTRSDLNSETLLSQFANPIDAVLARSALMEAGYTSSQLSLTIIQDETPQPDPRRVELGEEKGFMGRIAQFFKARNNDDLYSKETQGHESYLTAGQPCHGGYGVDQTTSRAQEPSNATPQAELVLSVSGVRGLEAVIAIIRANNGNVSALQGSPHQLSL